MIKHGHPIVHTASPGQRRLRSITLHVQLGLNMEIAGFFVNVVPCAAGGGWILEEQLRSTGYPEVPSNPLL
ncbi:hypothetical protein Baya_13736 [Bagarius yarrelli]|uniref:Uncharacterized protein n=1 Tax=Bagarius yarrelli TaxID=175774 RepID=A0A556V790_BAGYA|nr:hypothetical protein Baya_13736 [Bagarius yarrelli]